MAMIPTHYPPAGWETLFRTHFWNDLTHSASTEQVASLIDFVQSEYAARVVYPAPECVFRAFFEVPMADVRVVILGQDPVFMA